MSDDTEAVRDEGKGKRLSARQTDRKVDELAGKLDRVVDSTNAAIDRIGEQLSRLADAIHNPVTRTHALEAAEQDMGPSDALEFSNDGTLEKPRLMDVQAPEFKEKAANLAFANEMVEVEIAEVSDRDAAKIFDVAVNGKSMVFERGRRYRVPRYIVEGLARARPVHYENQEYVDYEGVRKVRNPSRRGLRYPFSVVQDSDRGKAWLKNLLATA